MKLESVEQLIELMLQYPRKDRRPNCAEALEKIKQLSINEIILKEDLEIYLKLLKKNENEFYWKFLAEKTKKLN